MHKIPATVEATVACYYNKECMNGFQSVFLFTTCFLLATWLFGRCGLNVLNGLGTCLLS